MARQTGNTPEPAQIRTITCFVELPAASAAGKDRLAELWGPSIREAAAAGATLRGELEARTGMSECRDRRGARDMGRRVARAPRRGGARAAPGAPRGGELRPLPPPAAPPPLPRSEPGPTPAPPPPPAAVQTTRIATQPFERYLPAGESAVPDAVGALEALAAETGVAFLAVGPSRSVPGMRLAAEIASQSSIISVSVALG